MLIIIDVKHVDTVPDLTILHKNGQLIVDSFRLCGHVYTVATYIYKNDCLLVRKIYKKVLVLKAM